MALPKKQGIWHTDSIYYGKLLSTSRNVRLVTLDLQNVEMRTVKRLIQILKSRCAPKAGTFLSRRLQFTCFTVSGFQYMAISGIAEDSNHRLLLPSSFRDSYLLPTLEQFNIEIEVCRLWIAIPVS